LASRISDSAWFAQYYFLEPATLTPSDDTPRMGSQLQLSLQVPSEPAALWFVGLSGDSYPGIPVGSLADNPYRVIPLAADGLLAASVALGIGGSLDLQGNGQVQFHIPIDPSLFDVSFHAAALTITPSWTIGHISPSVWIHITP
jgi:hypothetical protein